MKIYAVERYFETKSYAKTISDFTTKLNSEKPLYKSVIVFWVTKFRHEGSVKDLRGATPNRATFGLHVPNDTDKH